LRLFLIRHGETEWNVKGVFRGRVDVPLSDVGVKQAEALGNYLSEVDFEAIYSSPLKRSLDTAMAIARFQKRRVDVIADERLIDISYGDWEGKLEDEVKKAYPDLYSGWLRNPHKVKFPRGESLSDVRLRLQNFINHLTSTHRGNVAVVSHRVICKVLICMLLGLDDSKFWNVRIDCGGITIFDYDNGAFTLVKHNDTSYFSGMQSHRLRDF
jgi:broad specificity phosphatase PhoE